MAYHGLICGCYYLLPPSYTYSVPRKQYLAQVGVKAHTTILVSTSRTVLTQTFANPSDNKGIKEVVYTFPLYDGVSVVAFTCRVGDRIITGEVKEKDKARAIYKEAKDKGEVAGLLEQLPDASDAFSTKIGNIPPGAEIIVEITYLGELKHDAEVDGIRFTIPTFIAPRYGSYPSGIPEAIASSAKASGFEVAVDAELGEGSFIREMRSPSHPIAISLGTTSLARDADPQSNKASATLSLGTAELDKDFVLQIVAKETTIPKAMLETHPTIPGQRALMATLVPKFALPPERPEIVFVCDRSGSMSGSKIIALRNALKVFLKSLPVGTKFNICSFGSSHSFLWSKSKSYSQSSLEEAVKHVSTFEANFGGTEMYAPMEGTIKRRYKDMSLEIFLVTDGEIWDQERLFTLLNQEIGEKKAPIRVFTLGVGDAFSSSLIEGVARAGNGFSQAVGEHEKLDGKVVRMLKAALSPHITDYTMEVKYVAEDGDEFEMVEKVSDSLNLNLKPQKANIMSSIKNKISLFDISANPDAEEPVLNDEESQGKYSHLPTIDPPKLLQAPFQIPPLFAFSRTTVYLLISPSAPQRTPASVILRGTSKHGLLELEIPVQVLSEPDETIHQLAAKKAVHELEQGRGWLYSAKDSSGALLKTKNEGRFSDMVEREAVRLGVEFQVSGKWCSFVAVENKDKEGDEKMAEDWAYLDEEVQNLNLEEHQRVEISARMHSHMSAPAGLMRQRATPMATQQSASYYHAPFSPQGYVAFPSAPASPHASYGQMAQGIALSASASKSKKRLMRQMATPMVTQQPASYYSAPFSPQAYASLSNAPASPYASYDQMAGAQQSVALSADLTATAPTSFGTPPGTGSRARRSRSRERSPRMEKSLRMSLSSSRRMSSEEEEDAADEDMGFGLFEDGVQVAKESVGAAAKHNHALPAPKPSAPPKFSQQATRSLSASYGRASKGASTSAQSPLQTLIDLQTFEGYWKLTDQLCLALGVDRAKVKDDVVATALAVHFLINKLALEKDSWELMVEKAKGWLETKGYDEDSDIWKTAAGIIS